MDKKIKLGELKSLFSTIFDTVILNDSVNCRISFEDETGKLLLLNDRKNTYKVIFEEADVYGDFEISFVLDSEIIINPYYSNSFWFIDGDGKKNEFSFYASVPASIL
ncbi:MAG TPA: hypothetical protein PLP33_29265 [Leptospiraceae bacterium]|nr:hypothetical protein [Leptospiraceae bacterium]